MQVKNQIPSAIIAAATGILLEYVPKLTAVTLISALEEYEESNKRHIETRPQRPYKISEVMELLDISKPTVYRMFDDGILTKIKLRGLTRIAAAEVNLLTGAESVNAENN